MAVATAAAVAAVASAALGTAAGVAAGAIALTWASAGAYFAATTAIGLALAALSPTPNFNLSSNSSGYKVTTTGSNLPRQTIYGRVKVGGVVIFDEVTNNNKFLHRVLAFADHEVDSFESVYFWDDEVTYGGDGIVTSPNKYTNNDLNRARIRTKSGTDSQTAYSELVSESSVWTSNHRCRGIATMYVRLKYAMNAFAQGVPNITAIVKGKKVYDPRTTTTAWSDNPSLCIRDYLVDVLGEPVDETSFSTAANDCDTLIDGSKRFTLNGSFTSDNSPEQILFNMLTSCGGTLWFSQGKWKLKVGVWKATVLDLDENDLRSGLNIITKPPISELFSTVKGQFRGDETDWEATDYPFITDAAYVTADGQDTVKDLDLPFTDNAKEAQRTANLFLRRSREQITFQASFSLKALQVEVGDNVRITNTRMGWSNKNFEVIDWAFSVGENLELLVDMTLKETSSAVYNDPSFTNFSKNNTNLPSWNEGLEVQNLTVSDGGYVNSDGTYIPTLIIDWDPPTNDGFVDRYSVQWKRTADSKYTTSTARDTEHQTTAVEDGVEYVVRVATINNLGFVGDWVSTTHTAGGDTTAPATPTSFQAYGDFKRINLEWTNPADADFSHVEVWESATATFGSGSQIASSWGDSYTRPNLGLDQARYYWIRSVDYSGNKSSWIGPQSATTTYLDDPDFENGIYTLFTDQGLYAIRDVTSLPGSGAFVGEKVFNRTDGKLYQWDGSSWDLVVAAANTGDLVGQITETQIADNSISTGKLQTNSITSNEIAVGTIVGGNISGSTITGNKIVANTITGGLLATSGIITNSAQINSAVIKEANIDDLNVTRIKIAGNAINNAFESYTASTSWRRVDSAGNLFWFREDTPGQDCIVSFAWGFRVAPNGDPGGGTNEALLEIRYRNSSTDSWTTAGNVHWVYSAPGLDDSSQWFWGYCEVPVTGTDTCRIEMVSTGLHSDMAGVGDEVRAEIVRVWKRRMYK